MKKIPRITLGTLLVALALVLASCGNVTGTGTGTTPEVGNTTPTLETLPGTDETSIVTDTMPLDETSVVTDTMPTTETVTP